MLSTTARPRCTTAAACSTQEAAAAAQPEEVAEAEEETAAEAEAEEEAEAEVEVEAAVADPHLLLTRQPSRPLGHDSLCVSRTHQPTDPSLQPRAPQPATPHSAGNLGTLSPLPQVI